MTGSIGKLPIQAQKPSTATNRDIAESVFYQASQHTQSSKLINELKCKRFQGVKPAEFWEV